MIRFGDDKPAPPGSGTGWTPSDSDWTAFLKRHPKWKGKKPAKPSPPRAALAAALGPPPATGGGSSGSGGFSIQQAAQLAQQTPSMVSAASSAIEDISAALSGEMGDELQESSDWGLAAATNYTQWKTPTHLPGLADPAGLASFGASDESSESNASDGGDPNEIESYRLNAGVAGVGNIMIGGETGEELIDGDNYDFGFDDKLYNGYDRAWLFGADQYIAPPTGGGRLASPRGGYGGGYGRGVIPSRSIAGKPMAPRRVAVAPPRVAAPQVPKGYWCSTPSQTVGSSGLGMRQFYYSSSDQGGCQPVFGADQLELTEDIPGAIENTGDLWAPPDADFFYDMELDDDAADFDVDDEILMDGDLGEVNEILGGDSEDDDYKPQKGRRR